MTLYSGLFNSINGDRKYDEWWFARYFSRFIGNGVFPNPSTGLQVTEGENMTTVIKAGDGWINGYFIMNDGNHVLQHDISDGVLSRIDRVVMQLDYSGRVIRIIIKKGIFSSEPVAPELQRDLDYYELALADVFIKNGTIYISQADITDLRLNNELCGIVHGTVDQVDTTTLFNQYQSWMTKQKKAYEQDMLDWSDAQKADFLSWRNAESLEFKNWKAKEKAAFDSWFLTIKDILDENTAGNLQNQIEALGIDITSLRNDIDDISGRVDTLEYNLDNRTAYVKREEYVSTDGQTVFILVEGEYTPNTDRISVTVGGVPQYSPVNFIESSTASVTMTEPLVGGLNVVLEYFSDIAPITTDIEGRITKAELDIGDKRFLETTDKSSLVSAVNEVELGLKNNDENMTSLSIATATHLAESALFEAEVKGSIIVKNNISILSTGWIDDTFTSGFWLYEIIDADITVNTVVDVNIHLVDLEKASAIKSSNLSSLGKVALYADGQPAENILVDLKLVKQVV